jgi:hypothetical protein
MDWRAVAVAHNQPDTMFLCPWPCPSTNAEFPQFTHAQKMAPFETDWFFSVRCMGIGSMTPEPNVNFCWLISSVNAKLCAAFPN